MSWKEQILIWEETEHPWDEFGVVTDAPNFDDDPLHAKPLVIWKAQSLDEIFKKITDAASSGVEYVQDPDVFSGFLLAVSALNLFPLHIKIINEDEHANTILQLLHEDNGEEFFLKSELKQYPDLEYLIEYYIKNKLFISDGDKLVIQGKVLNRSFLKE